jgi:hypothetical protein
MASRYIPPSRRSNCTHECERRQHHPNVIVYHTLLLCHDDHAPNIVSGATRSDVSLQPHPLPSPFFFLTVQVSPEVLPHNPRPFSFFFLPSRPTSSTSCALAKALCQCQKKKKKKKKNIFERSKKYATVNYQTMQNDVCACMRPHDQTR